MVPVAVLATLWVMILLFNALMCMSMARTFMTVAVMAQVEVKERLPVKVVALVLFHLNLLAVVNSAK